MARTSGEDALDASARTRRTGNSAENFNAPDAWVPQCVVGAIAGFRTCQRWSAARDVRATIEHIRKRPSADVVPDQWLRARAAEIMRDAGPTGQDGALGQLRGDLFELLDIRDHNFRRVGGYRLVQFRKSFNRFYDANRFDTNGKYAGPVQHKLGPSGIPGAIKKLDAHKHGLAKRVTFRVPDDRLEACVKAAQGRTRVTASRLSKKTVDRIGENGLDEIAAHCEAATSPARQAGRAAVRSAIVGIVVGGLVDLHALVVGAISTLASSPPGAT